MMTPSKETQVTFASDKALRRGCIKEKVVCECAVCSNLLSEKERHGSALFRPTLLPVLKARSNSPMEPTLNTEGAK